ncbi:toll/interleukin-1 receptor domain-containing protein [Amycolatopsis suaedae]|uniref:Toll/interleukin-1 receptor domain-containing protein n=1 Tax=Amycolatopsis suaedae TaxID=2510978 RepID=A0A4Q7J843_9PSEU|nr:toll/interleukin-1 receptor domain-containing protein [Amycolatopsis suaedae]RZQ63379.1 toll/interleukin-1 receptor domain-containing protein [Amycolatopsis suaedae]
MSGYKYDVFISYSRQGSVQKWLLNHFHKKLEECLADQYAPAPKVYVDRSMPRGVHWPSHLQQAIRHSKIILPLLTPNYFESNWCMAELRSMQERQKALGLGTVERPQTLIHPVLYSDSDNFPDEGREYSWWDFKAYANPEPPFQVSPAFSDFHFKVVELAKELVELLKQVPDWRDDWPVVDPPDPYLIPPPPLPRFGP